MIYLIYGLSGPMKKLFMDILRETYALGPSAGIPGRPNDDGTSISNDLVNLKGTTRTRRYYDDDLMEYFHNKIDLSKGDGDYLSAVLEPDATIDAKKQMTGGNRYKDDYSYQYDGDAGVRNRALDTFWYSVNTEQLEVVASEGWKRDHFIICNNIQIIKKIANKYEGKCTIVKVESKDPKCCLTYLQKKYAEIKNDYKDLDPEDREQKVEYIILADQNEEARTAWGDWKDRQLLKKIDISCDDGGEKIEQTVREGLFAIVNECSEYHDWKRLLSPRRIFSSEIYKADVFLPEKPSVKKEDLGLTHESSFLTPFIEDYSSISSLASFRRMQDKCQVFPLKRYDYARTRLTHSMEVAATAEALGDNLVQCILKEHPEDYDRVCRSIPYVLRNAALLHDMGNPPFGHFSEDAVRLWFKNNLPRIHIMEGGVSFQEYGEVSSQYSLSGEMQSDLYNYEGNAHLFRLLTTLARQSEKNDDNNDILFSPNLTMATIAATIKYPISSSGLEEARKDPEKDINRKKNGYFTTEKESFDKIDKELGLKSKRHPLAFLLEAADDITYYASDLEDALKRKLITFDIISKRIDDLFKSVDRLVVAVSLDADFFELIRKKEKRSKDEILKLAKLLKTDEGTPLSAIEKEILKLAVPLNCFSGEEDCYYILGHLERCDVKLNKLKDQIIKYSEKVNNSKNAETVVADLSYKHLRSYIQRELVDGVQLAFRSKYMALMSKNEDDRLKQELLEVSDAYILKILISDLLVNYVYHSSELVRNQLKAAVVLDTLLKVFIKAALKMGYDHQRFDENKPEDATDRNVYLSFSENYRIVCQKKNEEIDDLVKNHKLSTDEGSVRKTYNCVLLAMDMFAGMTDSFAMDMYHLLTAQ